ncbi:hypothetical protein BXZ70DRAFT_1077749 [Cristinia sonorae]|uniref:Uncharacterized protein n=1 Tax=Cristinia sonorae TaxID=1940300 RepID=A0A8K0UMX1_9AGAR|nr:hypothetical protein BXZ70DRAFT_1077749 [Cristinia sonorae]
MFFVPGPIGPTTICCTQLLHAQDSFFNNSSKHSGINRRHLRERMSPIIPSNSHRQRISFPLTRARPPSPQLDKQSSFAGRTLSFSLATSLTANSNVGSLVISEAFVSLSDRADLPDSELYQQGDNNETRFTSSWKVLRETGIGRTKKPKFAVLAGRATKESAPGSSRVKEAEDMNGLRRYRLTVACCDTKRKGRPRISTALSAVEYDNALTRMRTNVGDDERSCWSSCVPGLNSTAPPRDNHALGVWRVNFVIDGRSMRALRYRERLIWLCVDRDRSRHDLSGVE